MTYQYVKGAELPDFTANFRDASDDIIDMSSGWTFSAKLATEPDTTAIFTKSTGISGGASPSVTIQWATTGELNDVDEGTYSLLVIATRSSDSRQRKRYATVQVLPDVT